MDDVKVEFELLVGRVGEEVLGGRLVVGYEVEAFDVLVKGYDAR